MENELSDRQQSPEKQRRTAMIEERSTESDAALTSEDKTDESSDDYDRDEDFDSDSSFECFDF